MPSTRKLSWRATSRPNIFSSCLWASYCLMRCTKSPSSPTTLALRPTRDSQLRPLQPWLDQIWEQQLSIRRQPITIISTCSLDKTQSTCCKSQPDSRQASMHKMKKIQTSNLKIDRGQEREWKPSCRKSRWWLLQLVRVTTTFQVESLTRPKKQKTSARL